MAEAGKAIVKFLQDVGFERIEAFAPIKVEKVEDKKIYVVKI